MLTIYVLTGMALCFFLFYQRIDEHGDPKPGIINMVLAWLTPLIGILGIVLLWVAYFQEWDLAVSLGWSIGCTLLLGLVTIILALVDLCAYLPDLEDDEF